MWRSLAPLLGGAAVDGGPSDVGPAQRRFAFSVILALVAMALLAAPFADVPLAELPSLLAVFSTAMFITNLLLAALLFIKGRVEGRPDTISLGAASLYVCLIIVPYTLSFPGGILPVPLIGHGQLAPWFWNAWHVGFALAVTRYAWSVGTFTAAGSSIVWPVLQVCAAVAVVTAGLVLWGDRLPSLIAGGQFSYAGIGQILTPVVVCLSALVALASVARLRAARPEQLWLLVGLVASGVEVVLTLRGSARFSLGWYLARLGSLLTSGVVLISMMHEIARLYSEVAASNAILARLAREDGLTGLSNRRHFDEMLELEFRRARRAQVPLALILLDVDHFKGYNDRYGHPAGDACLRCVAAAIRGAIHRPGDSASRYGGEEFAVLLPGTDAAGAAVIAERIRQAVMALALPHQGSGYGIVTVSSGFGWTLPGRDDCGRADLIEAADQALYRAKQAGRNRALGDDAPAQAAATEPHFAWRPGVRVLPGQGRG